MTLYRKLIHVFYALSLLVLRYFFALDNVRNYCSKKKNTQTNRLTEIQICTTFIHLYFGSRVPYDAHIFPKSKKSIQGTQLDSDVEVQLASLIWFGSEIKVRSSISTVFIHVFFDWKNVH